MTYEFKKGDRVRRINVINTSYFKVGGIGVVSEECNDKTIVYVTSNNRKTANFAVNLELVKEDLIELRDLLTKIIDTKYQKDT